MNEIECYKIVRCIDIEGKLFSYNQLISTTYTLEYKVGEFTNCIPGTMGIFCFKDYDSAHTFRSQTISRNKRCKIYKCIGINEVISEGMMPNVDDIDEYYDLIFNDKYFTGAITLYKFPRNTICFEKVKLLHHINHISKYIIT